MEYPCIAWGTIDPARTGNIKADTCELWRQTMGDKIVTYTFMTEDRSGGFFAILSLPSDDSLRGKAELRSAHRIGAMAEAYGILAK